jgi:hypothetical protein
VTPFALSRTCDLSDFAQCVTVASWQQRLADHAWQQWESEHHVRTRQGGLCVNWSGCTFTAPGPEAIYRYRGHNGVGIEGPLPAVYGLSVLDHTDAPVRFLTHSAQLLRKHGLLFLTFAFWDAEGPDCAEGHADRARIYDVHSYKKLVAEARKVGYQVFGGMDWSYHGDKLEDHSLASLVLTRR